MLDLLKGFPDYVIAVAGRGRVTARDFQTVLVPRADAALARHSRVRCYFELGPDCAGVDAGAVWEDFKLGIEHMTRWERVAMVTDVDWIRLTMGAFGLLPPGEIKVFGAGQVAEARAWITAG